MLELQFELQMMDELGMNGRTLSASNLFTTRRWVSSTSDVHWSFGRRFRPQLWSGEGEGVLLYSLGDVAISSGVVEIAGTCEDFITYGSKQSAVVELAKARDQRQKAQSHCNQSSGVIARRYDPEKMKRCKKRREPGRLLPRIPDEVTLDLIAPKLSWGDCRRLAAVSRAWSRAIQSRKVHDARVRLRSTETLLLLSCKFSRFSRAITIFSIRENCGYELPPIPYPDGRLAPASSCVSLDGKIYALGGESVLVPTASMIEPSNGVHVLDLAEGTKWERCASMREPRVHFGCGVVDGEMYVFGGFGHKRAVCGSEVYDPKKDSWSPIKAMTRLQFDHQVAIVGSELVVHGGKFFEWDGPGPWNEYEDSISEYWYPRPPTYLRNKVFGELCYPTCGSRCLTYIVAFTAPKANSLEVYDAVKAEWTVVECSGKGNTSFSFMVEGKLHSIDAFNMTLKLIRGRLCIRTRFSRVGHRGLMEQI